MAESRPVLIKCEDIYVAIDLDILRDESEVINSMLEDLCHRSDDTSDDDNAPCETRSTKLTKGEVDILELFGFDKEAVKLVFGDLAGFEGIVNICDDFDIYFKMLEICAHFDIHGPIHEIKQKFKTYPTLSCVDSFIEAFKMAEKIDAFFPNLGETKDILFKRCVAYARSNFLSWEVILEFIRKNETNNEFTWKLFQELNKQEAIIRRKVEDIENVEKEGPSYIIGNLEWKILCKRRGGSNDYLGLFVQVDNPSCDNYGDDWSCLADVELNLVDQVTGYKWHHSFLHRFCQNDRSVGKTTFKEWSQVTSGYNYVKDGTLLVEAEIKIKSTNGLKTSFGNTFSTIGWFDKSPESKSNGKDPATEEDDICKEGEVEENDDSNESDQESEANSDGSSSCAEKEEQSEADKTYVLLHCKDIPIVLEKSLLVRQSGFFKKKFEEESNSEKQVLKKEDFSLTQSFHLSNYDSTATKALFDLMQGFPQVLNSIQKFETFNDMIDICKTYEIDRFEDITNRIRVIDFPFEEVVEAYKVSKLLETIDGFDSQADELKEKCVAIAGSNLASWQYLVSFIVNNKGDNIDPAIEILKLLGNEDKCMIRHVVPDIENIDDEEQFIKSNALWNIDVLKTTLKSKDYLTVSLMCTAEDPDPDEWSCKVKNVEAKLLKNDGTCLTEHVEEHTFHHEYDDKLELFSMLKSEVLDKKNGFIDEQGKKLQIEVKFERDKARKVAYL
eukprot:TRINITY_DN13387_c0_g1_i8.p1 TRINITY_DN13387_c0_g1~~TRINITY_DN13387_c0_g1_i8.p1  ORF type:complete len:727 (+),score=147.32 TRINITY_DN13387_c0_g1_i8:49-2229(+)